LGGIYEFLEKKKLDSLRELERSTSIANPKEEKAQAIDSSSPRKLSYEEKKERDRAINRAEKRVKEAETEITNIEAEIAELENVLASGNNQDPEIYNRHAALGKKLDNAMSIWELASMELDDLKSK
jgi:ATP-binding cassette subfamily F protein 3